MPGLTMIMSSEQDSASLDCAMSIEEVSDRLCAMSHQESSAPYRCSDYIDSRETSCSSPPRRRRRQDENDGIDRDCRAKMVEWCYQVSDFCKFQRETVAIATSYLDRFLATSSRRARRALVDKKEFQLVAMTALYIAVKLFEPVAMDAGLMAQISHGCYDESDVVEMEEEILESLEWRVNGPTAHAFLGHLVALLLPSACDENAATTLFDFSKFQAEVAVEDYDLSMQKPSTVALAALLNSIEGIEKRLFPTKSRFQFFRLIAEASGINPFSPQVNAARARLLVLFSDNSGYDLPQIANLTPVVDPSERRCVKGQKLSHPPSPVSVATRHFKTRRSSFSAKCA